MLEPEVPSGVKCIEEELKGRIRRWRKDIVGVEVAEKRPIRRAR
jgi:hypothetical protein